MISLIIGFISFPPLINIMFSALIGSNILLYSLTALYSIGVILVIVLKDLVNASWDLNPYFIAISKIKRFE